MMTGIFVIKGKKRDLINIDFKVIHKTSKDGEIIYSYEGNIKTRAYVNDIFHCFNSDNLWICPKPGYEENFPWMED